jgi:hypothetical protein
MEEPDRPEAVRRQRDQLSFWVETPSKLFLLSGMQGRRIQFLLAMVILAFGTAQVSRAGSVGYLLLVVLVAWLCWVLWQASVKVIVERDFRRVMVQRRRVLGLMTYSSENYSFAEIEAVPVVSRRRYRQFGGETMWTVHLVVEGAAPLAIGTVVDDAPKIEKLLWLVRNFMGPRIADGSQRAAVLLAERPQSLREQLADSDGIVRAGQIGCLIMIAGSLLVTPGMAWFYVFVLLFGTGIDWLMRRSDG